MDDRAKRKETKNGRPSRKERNEKWTTQPKGKTKNGRPSRKERNEKWMTQPKGNKRKMDDLAERKETKNG